MNCKLKYNYPILNFVLLFTFFFNSGFSQDSFLKLLILVDTTDLLVITKI